MMDRTFVSTCDGLTFACNSLRRQRVFVTPNHPYNCVRIHVTYCTSLLDGGKVTSSVRDSHIHTCFLNTCRLNCHNLCGLEKTNRNNHIRLLPIDIFPLRNDRFASCEELYKLRSHFLADIREHASLLFLISTRNMDISL